MSDKGFVLQRTDRKYKKKNQQTTNHQATAHQIVPRINLESCQLCSKIDQESEENRSGEASRFFGITLVKIGPWIVCEYCLYEHEGPEEIDDFWTLFNRCLICNEKSPKDHRLVPDDFYRTRTPHQLGFFFCEDHYKNRCKRCWIETDG